MGKVRIAIDSGHGSKQYTKGKRTPQFNKDVDIDKDGIIDIKKGTQYCEHEANVGVAILLDEELKRCGFDTLRVGWDDENGTDDYDTALSLRQKAIRNYNCDTSISIHFNAFGDGKSFNDANGIATYIHSFFYKDSKEFANKIHSRLTGGSTQKNRGVKHGNFAMVNTISLSTTASVLLELSFMTNEHEAQELMANKDYWKESAVEIAKGVCDYYGIKYTEENVPDLIVIEKPIKVTPTAPTKVVVPTPVKIPESIPVKVVVKPTSSNKLESISGKVEIIYDGRDGINVRNTPTWTGKATTTVVKGEVFTVVGRIKVDGTYLYKLKSGLYITSNEKYVKFTESSSAAKTPVVEFKKKKEVLNKVVVAIKKVVTSKSRKDKIKDLQTALNSSYNARLKVDGIDGKNTKDFLNGICLKNYVENKYVKWVQQMMKDLKFSVDVDGRFGDDSEDVTKAYQKKYGLKADGMFGYGSVVKLLKLIK